MKLTQVFKYVTRRYIVGNFFRSFVTPIFGDRWRFGSIKTQTQTKSFSSTDERLGSNNQPMKATKNQSALFEIAFPKIQAQQDIPNAYETLQFNKTTDGVATVTLNRPKQLNAFNILMWNEFMTAFQNVDKDKDAKCIILTGNEKSFSTGMDLSVFLDIDIVLNDEPCQGRRKEGLAKMIQFFQDSVSATEHCSVPVIAAASGFCIGGALDVFTACDLRYCTADARFSIKETDLAMVGSGYHDYVLFGLLFVYLYFDLCYDIVGC